MTSLEIGKLAGFVFLFLLGVFTIVFHKLITEIAIKWNERFYGKLQWYLLLPKFNEFAKKYGWLTGGIILCIMSILAIISILLKK